MGTEGNEVTGSLDDHVHSSSSSPACPPPPIDTLPTEIIQNIFILTCPVVLLPGEHHVTGTGSGLPHSPEDPLILSMVCRRWQDITIACHALWATLSIKCSDKDNKAWNQWGFSKLRKYLSRSGSRPLSIRIDGSENQMNLPPGRENNDEIISVVLDLVGLHSERWRDMAFEFPLGQIFLQKLDSLEGQLPHLENICFLLLYSFSLMENGICVPVTRMPEIKGGKFLGSPSIKRISMGQCTRSVLQHIIWRNISEVEFKSSIFKNKRDLRHILEGLSVSTTALTFSNVSVISPQAEPSELQAPIRLEMVRELHITGFRGPLDLFVCPSLEYFDVEDKVEDEIVHFLENSSCALTHIHICVYQPNHFDPKVYSTIFQSASLSTLKSISLTELTDSILDLLDFDSHMLFPSLEVLRLNVALEIEEDGFEYVTSQIEGLQKIMKSRTQAMSPDRGKSLAAMNTPNSRQVGLLSTLKTCYFTFELEADRLDDDVQLAERKLDMLRLFCISRNIRIQQEILFRDMKDADDRREENSDSDEDSIMDVSE